MFKGKAAAIIWTVQNWKKEKNGWFVVLGSDHDGATSRGQLRRKKTRTNLCFFVRSTVFLFGLNWHKTLANLLDEAHVNCICVIYETIFTVVYTHTVRTLSNIIFASASPFIWCCTRSFFRLFREVFVMHSRFWSIFVRFQARTVRCCYVYSKRKSICSIQIHQKMKVFFNSRSQFHIKWAQNSVQWPLCLAWSQFDHFVFVLSTEMEWCS